MEGLVHVRDVMTKDVKTTDPNTSMRDVVEKMNKFRIGSVIVVEMGKPLGIVTQGDILRKIVGPWKDPAALKAGKVMSSPLHTVESEAGMEDAARKMVSWNVKRLPVTQNGKLVGVVTTTDLVKSTPALIGLLQEFIRARYVPPELRTRTP